MAQNQKKKYASPLRLKSATRSRWQSLLLKKQASLDKKITHDKFANDLMDEHEKNISEVKRNAKNNPIQ
jgi:hypothetical protein